MKHVNSNTEESGKGHRKATPVKARCWILHQSLPVLRVSKRVNGSPNRENDEERYVEEEDKQIEDFHALVLTIWHDIEKYVNTACSWRKRATNTFA